MKFRELVAEREGGASLALLHHIRRAPGGPDPHKEMYVVRLYREFYNRPALLVALLANQVFAAFANLVHQHLSPALRPPDEVVDNQMHVLFVALVVEVTYVVSPVEKLPHYLQDGNHTRLSANANASPYLRMASRPAALRAIL
jgi:hypothetical protein